MADYDYGADPSAGYGEDPSAGYDGYDGGMGGVDNAMGGPDGGMDDLNAVSEQADNGIVVKVVFTKDNSQKSIRFTPEMTVEQQIAMIKQKYDIPEAEEYVLYLPEQKKMMLPDKVIEMYNVEKANQLEFRPRRVPVRVKMPDNSTKVKLFDTALTAGECMIAFGKVMDMPSTEEFGFQHDSTSEWLEPTVIFLEQYSDGEVIALRKKFFMDDKNISTDDPVKLHIVYTECNTGILNGSMPVKPEEAAELAALMLQVEKGDLDKVEKSGKQSGASAATGGFGSEFLRQYLPQQYKSKNLDRSIFASWRQFMRMNTNNAKLRYVLAVRALKTFGITMFEVQEKAPGKSKLQRGLMGITRSSVVRMSTDKTILQDWPLKQIKRWAAGDGVFTLDFGNHAGEYYMVFTKEGERISKLISGYIDLLLKKRRDTGHVAQGDAVEVATVDDVTSALAARAVARVGRQEAMASGQTKKAQVSISDVRQDIVKGIADFGKMTVTESIVGQELQAPRFIADVASAIRSNIDDLMSGDKERTASALGALSGLVEEFQRSYQSAASQGVGAGVLNLAANEDNLLAACRAVNDSVVQLLGSNEAIDATLYAKSAKEGEQPSLAARDTFDPVMFSARAALAAVQSQATADSMNTPEMQHLLHELSHHVQYYMDEMVNTASMLQITDKEKFEALKKRLAILSDQEMKLMRLLAPTASEAQAQALIAELSNAIKGTVAELLDFSKLCTNEGDEEYFDRVFLAAQGVSVSLDQLLHATQAPGLASEVEALELYNASQGVVVHLGTFIDSQATEAEKKEALKSVKEGLMTLIKASKKVAATNASRKHDLLGAAQHLVASIKALENAMKLGVDADDVELANTLDGIRISVADLVSAAGHEELGATLKAALIGSSAKSALASVLSLRMQALEAIRHMQRDSPAYNQLKKAAEEVVGCTQEFLAVLTLPIAEQDAAIVQAVTNFLPEAANLVAQSLATLPEVNDKKCKNQLAAQAHTTNEALTALARINKAYQPHGNIALAEELAPITQELETIASDIEALAAVAAEATIEEMDPATAEQVREQAFRTLNAAGRALASSVAKMADMPTDELPIEADAMLKAVRRIFTAVKGFSNTTRNPRMRGDLLKAASEFCKKVNDLTDSLKTDRSKLEENGVNMNISMQALIDAARGIIIKEMEEAQAKKAKVVEDVAERELLGAASVIKAAMAKLVAAQQSAVSNAKKKGMSLDESGISEELLEFARDVVMNSGTLIEHATEAQRELNGSAPAAAQAQRSVYKKDPKWEQGLISAAKAVAGSVQFLVRAANDHIRGNASEFSIIAAAKTVAMNAAQLQASTNSKLDVMSEKRAPIQRAVGQVNTASQKLVKATVAHSKAVRGAEEEAEIREAVAEAQSVNEMKLRVLRYEAENAVHKLEEELKEARKELATLRKKRYEDANRSASSVSASQAMSSTGPAPNFNGSGPRPGAIRGGVTPRNSFTGRGAFAGRGGRGGRGGTPVASPQVRGMASPQVGGMPPPPMYQDQLNAMNPALASLSAATGADVSMMQPPPQ